MKQTKSVSQSFDILVKNHKKLHGSKVESLEIACETVFNAFSQDPSVILGPICEQITRTTKKARRQPYLDVAQWLHEKATTEFDKFVVDSITGFLNDSAIKRQAMGCCIIIRVLAISSCGRAIIGSLIDIIQKFTSDVASLFEMEIFNTTLFLLSVTGITDIRLQLCASRYSIWMENVHPISSAAARELLHLLSENSGDPSFTTFIPLLRTDIPPSIDRCREIWHRIAPSPFESPRDWVEFGLIIGRFEDEYLREQLATLSTEKGQFSSIITVALSMPNMSIQSVARSLFRFGIHGQETAAFDPHSLSQILESKDDLTDIAITFLTEMALANAKECVPQLFPLLSSEKECARKNSLELLSRILKGPIDKSIRQMIATNLLPMVGDEAINVRVDIPKLFVSVPPTFIVPPLIHLLSDKDERKRSVASASMSLILKETKEPELLLRTILDCAVGGIQQFSSPADMESSKNSPTNRENKATERALKIVEKWVNDVNEKDNKISLMLDPNPVLKRLWDNPTNDVIVSFLAKSAPLYDQTRLLSAIIDQLKIEPKTVYDKLAPLLVLRSQPVSFFTTRESVASPLFSLLFVNDETEEKSIRNLRCELISRFPPNFVMPQLIDRNLFTKFCLCVVCYAGQFHHESLPLPYVVDLIEEKIVIVEEELFIPCCDAFYFSDRKRFIQFGIKQDGSRRGLLMLNSAVRKFTPNDCLQFMNNGYLDQVLKMNFKSDEEQQAVDLLFIFSFQCKEISLDKYWETLFDIASHYSDSKKAKVRFSALKLIGAILSNSAAESHLFSSLDRIKHIVEVDADDMENPDIRALANELMKIVNPSASMIKPE
ncbi:hypothetical protein M9Y10_039078 [Tritrichomonas musculus]|uniref:HEAT repeat family protein n=1 Tax=Tritrichomonas musculus TaxID=1915356 RepID=A0ABR2KAY9_9EUKA